MKRVAVFFGGISNEHEISVLTGMMAAGLLRGAGYEVLPVFLPLSGGMTLAMGAERPEDIDANRAQRAADQAREELLQKKSIQEYRTAQAQLARAISRLRVKNSYLEGKQ